MRALVTCDNPGFGLGIVRSLGAMGARAHLMAPRRLVRTRFSRYCEAFAYVPATEMYRGAVALRRINEYCARERVDVLICGDLPATMFVSEMQAEINVPVFPVAGRALLETLHDKWRFYELLVRLRLPTPLTRRLEAGESLDTKALAYPVIAKPPASEGGDRVGRFDTREELEQMLFRPESRRAAWLVQDYIPGRDIDLSILADRGRIVAWTIQSGEGGERVFERDERLLEIGRRICEATCFHGVAHFDMRIDDRDGGVRVIECNPRFWGSLMLSTWSGVNFVEVGCAMALGGSVPLHAQIDGTCAHQGFAPLRMLKALLNGRTAPEGLGPAMLASWRQMHADPLPELLGSHVEELGERVVSYLSSAP
jgi:predicted ATP-grasp superfamily ATP-dependent carboligase